MNKYLATMAIGGLFFLEVSICFAGSIYFHSGSPLARRAESDKAHVFTVESALRMQQFNMTTSTNWTDTSEFKGVRISDVLEMFNLTGTRLYFRALDGYSYEIPISDVGRYSLLLAYERDGINMTIDTLGPFALIYPRSSFPKELNGPETDAKFIWMIKDVFVE